MQERTHIGVGLISAGWMGRLHSRAYRAVPVHFPEIAVHPELVVAADPDERGRQHAEEVLGFQRTVADYREVLADPKVDVVSICSPNFLHHEMALAAVEAGKPFWIEKPMGRSLAESREIAEAAEAAGLVTAVGFNYRHAPAIARARELVRSGALGTVTNVRVSFLADYSADPLGVLTWRFLRDKAGSGVMGDLLSHGVDLAQFVVGRIAAVSATTETVIRQRPLPSSGATSHFASGTADAERGDVENEDYAAALARFASGAVGIFDASRVARGARAEYRLEVYGTEGSLRWNFERLNELEYADTAHGYRRIMAEPTFGEFRRFQPGAGTSMGFDDFKTVEAALFLQSVLSGRQLAPSAADGWSAAAIVDAAERSADSGRWEQVDGGGGRTTYDS